MKDTPIRILRIVAVMNRGGIESQIMNIYRELDRSRFQFDFLVTRNEEGVFDREIEQLGGRIYRIPSIRTVGLSQFIKSIKRFFEEHDEYKIIHSHMNTWSGLFLNIAKKNNIPIRIAHSHSAQQRVKHSSSRALVENLFKNIMKLFIKQGATHFWAVGKAAGEWLYGEKVAQSKMKVVPNAKNINKFKFDLEARELLRAEFGISSSQFVIGHIGSFSDVKNHDFLINLFSRLIIEKKESKLCLVGDGHLRVDIEKQIEEKSITDKVLLLGLRNDVNKLLSVFDVLILPSKFEGMPNVLIEAQAAGLKCIVSDTITREIDVGMELIQFVSLNDPIERWIKEVTDIGITNRNMSRDKLFEAGYDLQKQIQWLERFYKESSKLS